MPKRNIIKIDEDLCNGCGLCIGPCSEGALVLENGKVKVVKEELCDGAGLCIGECPVGALEIEEREAPVFTPRAILPLDEVNNDINCLLCGKNDEKAYLLQLRKTGEIVWVCTGCLPRLIHG
ncbi:MAG: 4Fe-4S binding protein [Syntrophomonadaceae bacterium]